MTTFADITTATPAEIDEQLDTLSYEHMVAITRATQYQKISNDYFDKGMGSYGRKYMADAEGYAAKAADLMDQIRPLNAEFSRRGGWTRAFLVVNSNGHVHRNRECTTCFADTRYAWMTDFSGMDEDAIVDAAGERACTVCYPTAPVSVLNQPTKMFTKDEIAAQERKAELAAKKDAAAKAAVRNAVTGEVEFKTERAARNEINRLLGNSFLYDDAEDQNQAQDYMIHLANHLGVTYPELRDEMVSAAATKFRKSAIKIAKQNLAGKAPIMTQHAMDPANWHDSIRTIAKEEGLI
jgi:hypothetical protein